MMRWTRGLVITLVALALVGGAVVALAQSVAETPPRPVSLFEGTCKKLGNEIAILNTVTLPENVALERAGSANSVLVETSFSRIPLPLDSLLVAPHAIAVTDEDASGDVLACGDIGGIIDENGALTFGLPERNESGFSGIAFLSPDLATNETIASIFFSPDRDPNEPTATPSPTPVIPTPTPALVKITMIPSDGTPITIEVTATGTPTPLPSATPLPTATATPTATPTVTPTGGTIDISLSEWEIDMPIRLKAGPAVFVITNDGKKPHNFVMGNDTWGSMFLDADLAPGESGTLAVNLAPGTYVAYDPLEGAADKGMTLTIEIVEE